MYHRNRILQKLCAFHWSFFVINMSFVQSQIGEDEEASLK